MKLGGRFATYVDAVSFAPMIDQCRSQEFIRSAGPQPNAAFVHAVTLLRTSASSKVPLVRVRLWGLIPGAW